MKDRRIEILGILLFAVSLFVGLSFLGYRSYEEPGIGANVLIENPMGILGVYVGHYGVKMGLGFAIGLLPALGLIWSWYLFYRKSIADILRLSGYVVGLMFLFSVTVAWAELSFFTENMTLLYSGFIGSLIARLLIDFLGIYGSAIILFALWLILARGYFEWNFADPLLRLGEKLKQLIPSRQSKAEKQEKDLAKRKHTRELLEKISAQRKREVEELAPEAIKEPGRVEKAQEPVPVDEPVPETPGTSILQPTPPPAPVKKEPQETTGDQSEKHEIEVGEMVVEEEVELDAIKARKVPRKKFQLPKSELLTSPIRISEGQSNEELIDRANFLTQSLATFGVEGKVVNVHPGPVITLFEIEPAEGVRVNKFVQLSDDLARVMEASRVRVIAPIPGKSSVGIEIPNRNPATVYFKSVINSEKFAQADSKLTLAIGKTTSGEIATLNLAKMPHLLIAGTTGSGKSVCLNTIICSILYQATPDEVQFMIIDPKKVEMTLYRSLDGYYLLGTEDIDEPIITSTENAILALKALEKEMDRRYTVLADAVVRNIDEYNARARKNKEAIMPYIILIVDELADLMMMSAKDVEAPIARMAQLARAVGIHLVIATQRPSVDVITGVIKANFPARIAFQVATKIDSRTILDSMGAEKLIGRGDMLYLGTGSSEITRMHNAFISLEEIEAIMNHIAKQPKFETAKLASIREPSPVDGEFESDTDDELFKEAIRLVVTHQQGSISLIQRRLKVGYSRAARMIDQMEQLGVVGPFTGSKAREVLVDELYLQNFD